MTLVDGLGGEEEAFEPSLEAICVGVRRESNGRRRGQRRGARGSRGSHGDRDRNEKRDRARRRRAGREAPARGATREGRRRRGTRGMPLGSYRTLTFGRGESGRARKCAAARRREVVGIERSRVFSRRRGRRRKLPPRERRLRIESADVRDGRGATRVQSGVEGEEQKKSGSETTNAFDSSLQISFVTAN